MSETETARTAHTATTATPLVLEGHSPAGIPRARGIARAFAENLDPPPATETAGAFALVTCELATNALRHGGGPYTIELSATPETVSVAVSDRSPHPPRQRTPDLNGGTGGFGWPMVLRLAEHVTVTADLGGGKTILAQLRR
ncbi:ATP-binding protein [Streptomyces spirodelae]|uniref:ATP-binding protein n=1 Tax=Streptomyces spirodelae TaxID=2812904 RepID=A0ABS3WWF4_9ACTN|nr:ATP-binding protein [Streptomyces spirodelae]MBO8187474.1 ATP-binding protein [Streptomyces spirodelae]